MLSPERLQCYLRAAAARTHDVARVPPFELFFNPVDPLRFYNYAIPIEPVASLAPETLAALRSEFSRRERLLRFEFIREYALALGLCLSDAGLVEEGNNPLLICTREDWQSVQPVSGLSIREVEPNSPAAELSAFLLTQRLGFASGPAAADQSAAPVEIEDLRRRLRTGNRAFLAMLEGMSVSTGMFTAPMQYLAELVGIATLPEYRRRGIATALTGAMTGEVFAAGAEVAFLSVADEDAGRVYRRVGFRSYATSLAYCDPG